MGGYQTCVLQTNRKHIVLLENAKYANDLRHFEKDTVVVNYFLAYTFEFDLVYS